MYSIPTIDQQRAARRRAQKRFKNLNAATVWRVDFSACCLFAIALAAGVMTALSYNEPGAQPGKIRIKSELSKAELRTLQPTLERKQ